MKTVFSQRFLDTIGFWASAGCALHCLFLPLLLSVSAFSSLAFLDLPYVEEGIIALSVLLGLGSMLPSYFWHHKKFSALYILALGFSLIGLSRIVGLGIWEVVLTSAGAALIATAHISNHRLSKRAGLSLNKHS